MALPGRLVLLGHPVAHSLSPLFQNALLARAGISLQYDALDVAPEGLLAELEALRAAGAAGNVTVPHKESMAAACDWLTPLALRVGAVNTFWTDDEALFGDNTDVGGFVATVRAHAPRLPDHAKVVLLGAGGSASAVLAACEELGVARVDIIARTQSRAEGLAAHFAGVAHVASDPEGALSRADLVVNATPIGLTDDAMPIAPSLIGPQAAVVDLTYRRGETPWVHACRARGLHATDGLTMLVEQGALAFDRWFDHALSPHEVRSVIWSAIGENR
ncbi:MAG: shikimate dehydrogenase [bacterium]